MKCPLCGVEMVSGRLYGVRYALKWLPAGKRLFLGIWARGGEKIDDRAGVARYVARPFVKGYKCKHCKKIILEIDQNN